MASSTQLAPGTSSSDQDPTITHQSPKLTTIDLVGGIYCHICLLTFANKKDYDAHYSKHNAGSADIVYTCVVCQKQIVGYRSFRGHCYSIHVVKDRYKCKHCSKTLSKHDALQKHINVIHNFKCSIKSCRKQFTSKEELHLHKVLQHFKGNKPPYPCQTCEKEIDSLDSCEHHAEKHCLFTYSCPICNEAISKTNANEHLITHFGDVLNDNTKKVSETSDDSSINIVGGIFCYFCNEIYKNRPEFDSHFAAEHTDEDIIYTCNICKKKFEKYTQFANHCYNHLSKNKFVCDPCDRSFNRLAHLVLHTEMHHAGRLPLQCAKCDCGFKTGKAYREHLREKHDLQDICCPEPGCSKTFETPKDLILHQRNHKTLDQWCRQCGLQFSSLISCEKHLEVHKKKHYTCPVCSREYGEKYLLMNHIPQHFETVFHMCKVCGKIYNAKNRLVEHVKIHSSVKDYECKFCGKRFTKKNHLEQHLGMHTGLKPYKCIACPKTFAGYPNYHKHMRKMHDIDTRLIRKSKVDSSLRILDWSISKTKKDKDEDMSSSKEQSFAVESDQSTMDSDSIDLDTIEKESLIFKADMNLITDSGSVAELANVLHENNAMFVPVPETPQEATLPQEVSMPLEATIPQEVSMPLEATMPEEATSVTPLDTVGMGMVIPCEYGPDFMTTMGPADYTHQLIDLDDHILPHINPHLTTRPDDMYVQNILQYNNFEQNIVETIGNNSRKESPVYTKIYGNWEIDDITPNRLSVLNTDIY